MAADWTHTNDSSGGQGEDKAFFDKPKNVRLVMRGFYFGCAVVVILDIVNLVQHLTGAHELRHAEHPLENLPEFYVLYGFVGVALLVLISKGLRKILMRPEDYYDR